MNPYIGDRQLDPDEVYDEDLTDEERLKRDFDDVDPEVEIE